MAKDESPETENMASLLPVLRRLCAPELGIDKKNTRMAARL